MALMPRRNKKMLKIVFDILGKPPAYRNKKNPKKEARDMRLLRQDTNGVR